VMCSADRPCIDAGDCIHIQNNSISSELQVQMNAQAGMLMAVPFCGTKTTAMDSVGLSTETFQVIFLYIVLITNGHMHRRCRG
jgi:hypothetical protein